MTDPLNAENESTPDARSPVRILILEDKPQDAELMVRQLEKSGMAPEIRVVSDRPDYIGSLENFAPDLILADCSLPQFSAAEALQIRNQSAGQTPFITVSNTAEEEQAAACMRLGATDYLLKDQLARLVSVVYLAVEKKRLVDDSHRSRQALQRSEERYQELFLKMGDAVAVYMVVDDGGDFILTDLNPAAERIERFRKQEILGKSIREILPGIEVTGLLKIFRQVWRSGQFAEPPPVYYHDSRISGWRRTSIYKLNSHELMLVYADLTEQMESRQKLQASENKYRSIIDNIGLGVALINSEMKVLEMNPQMRRWFPRARSQEQPVCYEAFCDPPASGICNQCPVHATLQDGRVHELVHTTRVAGDQRKFRIVTSPIIDSQGWVSAAIEIMEDITEQQRLELQLRQAHKMEAIGTLAGGIAHDFNNILSAILGFTELCIDEAEPGSALEENLREVLHASHRARDLVRQILAFSRQGETDRKPIQTGLVIKEALKLLRSTLPSTIEIDIQINSHSLIMGDPTQIHQIIMNLGSNAADAMEAHGGVLAVSLNDRVLDDPAAWDVHLPPGAYQHLTVADTGDGIAAAHLESIFEPYFSTKPEGKGTGLGLSVVHGIVHSLEGGIRVRSEPGQGTVFEIFMPVMELQAPAQCQEDKFLVGGRENVLFVDDEPQIAEMAKRQLEKLGYGVEIRTDSREALELFKKRHAEFDLVIADVTMPHMSGDRLAREFLKIEPWLPIILCTGFSTRVSEQRLAQLGVKAMAMKPLVRDELARLVREVLDAPGG